MRKRYLVLALTSVLALAVAVPAIGQSSDPTATTSFSSKKKERKQNKRIRKAKQKAKKAKKIAQQALALAQQTEGDITTLNTRVTALEAVPGGPGPQGPAGEQGEPGTPGTPGPAGPSNFGLFNDNADGGDVTITADGFTLIVEDDCDVLLDATSDGFWELDLGNTPTAIDNSDPPLEIIDQGAGTWLVNAYQEDNSGVAQFQFMLNDVGATCDVAGSVAGSDSA